MNVASIEQLGWDVECTSPLEIRHHASGSYATGIAATIIIDDLIRPSVGQKFKVDTEFTDCATVYRKGEIHHVIGVSTTLGDFFLETIDENDVQCVIDRYYYKHHCVLILDN